ncbi:MAG: 16S rRNA (cytosine(1402)-N(4))-methyltransferase RsmH [Pirellulaceae bacterium]|nr:16S rRNA (cytosine(1402)-N(4))-methyltransferase RsmH [Pirellulaceae bacterium]
MSVHVPILLDEVIEWLNPQPGDCLVDGTLGGGGHAGAFAERVGATGVVVGIDRDRAALDRVEPLLSRPPMRYAQASFRQIPEVLEALALPSVQGVLLDLGLSSDQLADDDRGFSFDSNGQLDMRFDTEEGEPAWRLLERLAEKDLADLIYAYGEERLSRRIARRIVEQRRQHPIRTAAELADLVRSCVPRSSIDPATRTFQALRIAVNEELKALEEALRRIPDVLAPGGRLAIISFHSLEDRRVKEAFRDDERYTVLTKKPIRPNQTEQNRNPRSRSAKLRIAKRSAC